MRPAEATTIEAAMAGANPECHPPGELIDKDGRRFHPSGTDTAGAAAEPSLEELGRRMFES